MSGLSNKKRLQAFFIVIFVFLVIHFIASPVFGDDIKFRERLIQNNYNYFPYIYHRYFTWSSRFILEYFMMLILSLPSVLWKILDFGMVLLLYYLLSGFSSQYLDIALLICTYPFMHMASAGWIATTANYLWPFIAALAAFSLFVHKENKSKISCLIVYCILLLYAVNNEILSCLYIAALVIYLYISGKDRKNVCIQKRDKKLWVLISFFICFLGIVNVVICPGNPMRFKKEIVQWMPQFNALTVFSKFRICIVSTLQHFTSVPNVIFLLFSFLIAFIIWDSRQEIYKKVIGFIPFIISVGVTVYYFITNIIINHNINYLQPVIIIESGSPSFFKQGILLVLSVVYLVCILAGILFIYSSLQEKVQYTGIFMGGLASRFALVFSPTMLASGTRVYFIFYMCLVWIEAELMKKVKNIYILRFARLVLVAGIIINICMVYLMQRKYG